MRFWRDASVALARRDGPRRVRARRGRSRETRVRGRRDAKVPRLEEPQVSAGKRSSSREVCHYSGPTSDIPKKKDLLKCGPARTLPKRRAGNLSVRFSLEPKCSTCRL